MASILCGGWQVETQNRKRATNSEPKQIADRTHCVVKMRLRVFHEMVNGTVGKNMMVVMMGCWWGLVKVQSSQQLNLNKFYFDPKTAPQQFFVAYVSS